MDVYKGSSKCSVHFTIDGSWNRRVLAKVDSVVTWCQSRGALIFIYRYFASCFYYFWIFCWIFFFISLLFLSLWTRTRTRIFTFQGTLGPSTRCNWMSWRHETLLSKWEFHTGWKHRHRFCIRGFITRQAELSSDKFIEMHSFACIHQDFKHKHKGHMEGGTYRHGHKKNRVYTAKYNMFTPTGAQENKLKENKKDDTITTGWLLCG